VSLGSLLSLRKNLHIALASQEGKLSLPNCKALHIAHEPAGRLNKNQTLAFILIDLQYNPKYCSGMAVAGDKTSICSGVDLG
jgi:hypothetical protein